MRIGTGATAGATAVKYKTSMLKNRLDGAVHTQLTSCLFHKIGNGMSLTVLIDFYSSRITYNQSYNLC